MSLSFLFDIILSLLIFFFFFFNDTATTEIYTLSLHDALPISSSTGRRSTATPRRWGWRSACPCGSTAGSSTPTATTTPGSRRCSSSPPRRRASRTWWRARSPRATSVRPRTRSWCSAASASATASPGCCASSSTAAAPCPTRSSSTASAAGGSSSSSVSVFRLERLTRAEIAVLRAVAAAAGRRDDPVLVGGAVRDAWLRRLPAPGAADLDVAVPKGALDLTRRVAERLGGAFVPLDPERGTGRVVVPGVRLDVTDFRGPTLAADLAARDFTVNALAVSVRELVTRGRAPI